MIRDAIQRLIIQALSNGKAAGAFPDIEFALPKIERPKQVDHGDYSTNVAMVTAASLRKVTGEKVNPRQVAQQIVDHIPESDLVSSIELAGPGFINIRLHPAWLAGQVEAIVLAGANFGDIDRGQAATIRA